jgi:hypothetical protein
LKIENNDIKQVKKLNENKILELLYNKKQENGFMGSENIENIKKIESEVNSE